MWSGISWFWFSFPCWLMLRIYSCAYWPLKQIHFYLPLSYLRHPKDHLKKGPDPITIFIHYLHNITISFVPQHQSVHILQGACPPTENTLTKLSSVSFQIPQAFFSHYLTCHLVLSGPSHYTPDLITDFIFQEPLCSSLWSGFYRVQVGHREGETMARYVGNSLL